jgi:hypothetical protein
MSALVLIPETIPSTLGMVQPLGADWGRPLTAHRIMTRRH